MKPGMCVPAAPLSRLGFEEHTKNSPLWTGKSSGQKADLKEITRKEKSRRKH